VGFWKASHPGLKSTWRFQMIGRLSFWRFQSWKYQIAVIHGAPLYRYWMSHRKTDEILGNLVEEAIQASWSSRKPHSTEYTGKWRESERNFEEYQNPPLWFCHLHMWSHIAVYLGGKKPDHSRHLHVHQSEDRTTTTTTKNEVL
jgi:hypothetical protein